MKHKMYRLLRFLLLPTFLSRIVRIEGAEHIPRTDGFLLAANHIDYLDGFFLSAVIGRERSSLVQFLSETNNYWWTGGATIPIDPSKKNTSLDRALQAVQNGGIVCIFPEGRRNAAGMMLPGKTGLARLALWSGKPVIPLGIAGRSGRSFLDSVRLLLTSRQRMTIRIGPPLRFSTEAPDAMTKEELVATTDTIMAAIATLAEKTYHPSTNGLV